jgi:hypothetical protein
VVSSVSHIQYWHAEITPLVERVATAARMKAKTALETYSFTLYSSISNPRLTFKFHPEDKARLEGAVTECINWLDVSQEASAEEYEEMQQSLEAIAKYVYTPVPRSFH